MIGRDAIFRFMEDAGRAATGGREEMTLGEVYEAYGGRGSQATRRIADELGISLRQAQRLIARETGSASQTRGFGAKSRRFFRDLSRGELRRAGAREIRENGLTFEDGSTFELCYGPDDMPQGERQVRGDSLTMDDNEDWLEHFEARDYPSMERAFTDAFLEAYGVSGALDICDEDDGSNLYIAH